MTGNLYDEKPEIEEERVYNNEGEHFKDTKKYLAMVKKVIEQSDIVLEILDARDPLACRCKELEA